MAISKSLNAFTTMEALNSETASGWTEYTRQKIRSDAGETGAAAEADFELTSGHTVAYVYCEINAKAEFSSNSANNTGNNSLRIEKEKVHKFFIPNGATYLSIAGNETPDANKYAYLTTG
tara:strand:- start:78 stop:437 length:360 start_codon:yes stop_codon:yes gene_type:complete